MVLRLLLLGMLTTVVGLAVSGCAETPFRSASQDVGDLLFGKVSGGAPETAEPTAAKTADRSNLKGPLAMARLSERRGQTDQAKRLYRAILDKDPQNPVLYHRLGVISAKEARFDEAQRYFAKALQLAPRDAELLSDVGYFHYLQNRPKQAEETLRQALEIQPDHAAACNNLGVVLGEQGRYRESMALFKRTGTEAQANANQAFVYVQRGELDKAKTGYGRALTLDENLRPAAEALVQLAKFDQPQRQARTEWRSPAAEQGAEIAQVIDANENQEPQGEPTRPHRIDFDQLANLVESDQQSAINQ